MVKCLGCGAENSTSSVKCVRCGKPLIPIKKESTRLQSPPHTKIDHTEIARKLKLEYSHGRMDKNERAMDGILSLFSHLRAKQVDIHALLTDAANIIYKQLGIANVAIGLRSDSDGLFRYEVFVGFRAETEVAERKLAYSEKQFTEDTEYKGSLISKLSKIYLAEDMPYKNEEVSSYDHAGLLGMHRLSLSDSLEGDYIDTWILGVDGKLLGWIEISGLRTGKIPDTHTIKQIEVIASIIGAALAKQGR